MDKLDMQIVYKDLLIVHLESQYLIKQAEIKALWPVMASNSVIQHLVTSMEAGLKNIQQQIDLLNKEYNGTN